MGLTREEVKAIDKVLESVEGLRKVSEHNKDLAVIHEDLHKRASDLLSMALKDGYGYWGNNFLNKKGV